MHITFAPRPKAHRGSLCKFNTRVLWLTNKKERKKDKKKENDKQTKTNTDRTQQKVEKIPINTKM